MHMPTALESATRPRPFLKWAGGKRQLLPELRRFVPPRFAAYHEPFLGSGALFFDLWRRGLLDGRRCRLTDINPDLVGCYRAIASDVQAVVPELQRLAERHARDGSETYYGVRDGAFNPKRRALHAGRDGPAYPADLAAMFIYLNRTGYNGLFRLNARGDFNVPVGRYERPRICDEPNLRAAAAVLGSRLVEIRHEPFASIADAAASGDFVYLDPPYAPLSATARFTSYTSGSFTEDDQRRLQETVLHLARRGCSVVLSNSTAPLVSELYDTREARQAGLHPYRVSARRAINSNAGRRGVVEEFVISTVPPAG
jgi:DNA adenine methylase